MSLKLEWKKKKAFSNKKKHGVSFEEASTVFSDLLSLTIPDFLHSQYEDRLVIIGKSDNQRTLIVVHIERGDLIRIISARIATPHERKKYEESHGY